FRGTDRPARPMIPMDRPAPPRGREIRNQEAQAVALSEPAASGSPSPGSMPIKAWTWYPARLSAEQQAVPANVDQPMYHALEPRSLATASARGQINPQNPGKSTGPKTPEGKARSSQNAR